MSLTLLLVIVDRKGSVSRVQGLLVTDTRSLHTGLGLHTELVKVILETLCCCDTHFTCGDTYEER